MDDNYDVTKIEAMLEGLTIQQSLLLLSKIAMDSEGDPGMYTEAGLQSIRHGMLMLIECIDSAKEMELMLSPVYGEMTH